MIEKYLYNLLQDHDCVIVPGFGGFLAREQAAFIHPITHRIFPPSRKAAFNEQLQLNDGLLVMSVAAGEEIGQDEAMKAIRLFVTRLQTALAEQGKVELEKLGTFVLNTNKKLDFTPTSTQNLSENSFGLPELFFKPLDSSSDSMTKLPNKTIRPANRNVPDEEYLQLDTNGRPVKKKKSNAAVKVVSILVPILLVIGGAGFWVVSQQKDQNLQNLSFASITSIFSGEEKTPAAAPVVKAESPAVDSAAIVDETPTETAIEETPVEEAPAEVESTTKPAAVSGSEELNVTAGVKGHYYVVTGAFGNADNAVKQQQKLIAAGHFAVILNPGEGKLYKVCLGDFGTLDQAVQKKNELSNSIGSDGLWVLKY